MRPPCLFVARRNALPDGTVVHVVFQVGMTKNETVTISNKKT